MPIETMRCTQPTVQRRTTHILISLSASLLAMLFLIAGVHAAGSLPATAAPRQGQGAPGDERLITAAHNRGGDHDNELHGQLALPVTGFTGEWVLMIEETEQVSVVLTATTSVAKFKNQLPLPGDWLEVEGSYLPDGRFAARKVRPDAFEANQVIVRLKPTDHPELVAQSLAETYEMTVSAMLPSANIYLFSTKDDEEIEVDKLNDDKDSPVLWAEINWVSRAPTGNPYRTWKWGVAEDSGYANQHAFEQVNLAPALKKVTGAGVIVAILDTGIDLEHPAFDGSLILLANSNMISDTAAPDDIGPGLAWGHGTHVAGIVHGIAPNAKLMPIRILDNQGRGNTFLLAYAIELAVTNGADVINLSLGADCGSRILREAVASAVSQGVVLVAAAGNEGSPARQCPASLPGVLAVAAVDENRQRAEWSNYGEWVSLAAPGVGITSTFPVGLGAESNSTPGYASWSGTSMSTPFVAGAAALAVEEATIAPNALRADEMLVTYGDDISFFNPSPYAVGRHLNIGAAVDGLPTEPEPTAFTLFLPAVTR
ncbi:S8 family serine peptidase [Caldilinea sp.]|uniref:S8 family serine peptidase n=1 Tax=Caldilinea sp. TaxID=2293560 RepID=UPI0031CC606F